MTPEKSRKSAEKLENEKTTQKGNVKEDLVNIESEASWKAKEDVSELNGEEYSNLTVSVRTDKNTEKYSSLRLTVKGKIYRILTGHHELPSGEYPIDGIIVTKGATLVNLIALPPTM